MRLLLVFLLILSPFCLGDEPKNDEIITVEDDDAEMNTAMEKARKEIAVFKKAVEAKPVKVQMPMLKVFFSLKENPDEGEHMWVSDIRFKGKIISGILQSSPGTVKDVKLGDQVSFDLKRVSDWLFVKGGVAQGAYTVQLLRSRMDAKELARHDSSYPFKFQKLKK
ncbi:DUF2314 domain-containing protein [Akkermansiaceae bacterium]|nr:DUF2314 domain-containing protein [Akkermansiaceae bacterium]MDB4544742.1 DUF2314 domain-containing protein [Akkermansiaceae bacterium]